MRSAKRLLCAAGAMLLLGCSPTESGVTPAEVPLEPPSRIVVIGPSSAETLEWLGLADRVQGVSDYCSAPAFAALPRVGGQLDPNLERIAALEPDLVIVQGAHPKVEAWCARSEVRFLAWKTQSVEDWRLEVRTYGKWFQLGEAQDRLDAWNARFADAAAPAATESDPAPRVLIVASRDDHSITRLLVAGRGSFLGELLEHAGGASLFAGHERDYFDLAEEDLLQLQPDVVLELSGTQSDAERQALWADAFPELPASRNARVFAITADFVYLPGPRMLETVQLLRQKLFFEQ